MWKPKWPSIKACTCYSLAIATDPANISMSVQRYFNVYPQRWNNVDPTLKCWLGFFFALLSSSGADHNLIHLRIHFSDHWFNSYASMTGNYLKQNNCDNCCRLVIDSFLLRRFREIVTSNNKVFKSFTFYRSSHWRCSVKNGVLRNLAKFAGKHLCQSLFLIKL